MADDKGYKDTKEFTCVGCGKKIILTKFASQKTCKCDECKANNVPINPDIVAEALKANPPKERKKSSGGDTKILPCVKCGLISYSSNGAMLTLPSFDLSTVTLPPPDLDTDAPLHSSHNTFAALANFVTSTILPHLTHGSIFVCQVCYLRMWLSEQTHRPVKIYSPGKRFDYTGRQVKELGMSW